MDFSVAAPIQLAIERMVRDGDYGYPMRDARLDRTKLRLSTAAFQFFFGNAMVGLSADATIGS